MTKPESTQKFLCLIQSTTYVGSEPQANFLLAKPPSSLNLKSLFIVGDSWTGLGKFSNEFVANETALLRFQVKDSISIFEILDYGNEPVKDLENYNRLRHNLNRVKLICT